MDIEQEQIDYKTRNPSMLGRGIERMTHPLGKMAAGLLPTGLVKRAIRRLDDAAALPSFVKFSHDAVNIEDARAAAQRVERIARGVNASTGAASGFGGVWTMSADIPATIAIAMRNIRDTGRAYGYDGDGGAEQVFRLQILELAASDGGDARGSLIEQLEDSIAADGALKPHDPRDIAPLVDQVIERVSRALALAAARTRFGMAIPLIGSIVGGAVNMSFQKDVSQAARFAFQARRLKGKALTK